MSFWDWLFGFIFGRTKSRPGGPAAPTAPRAPQAPQAPQAPPTPETPQAGPVPAPPANPVPQNPAPADPGLSPSPSAPVANTFSLGSLDADVTAEAEEAYKSLVKQLAAGEQSAADSVDKDTLALTRLPPKPAGSMGVRELQQQLKALDLLPGGRVDGIYGYRTEAAVRLFQEFIRTVENQRLIPDGDFGPQTQAHLARWAASGRKPSWTANPAEYQAWFALLAATKQKYQTAPTRVLQMVNAQTGRSSTRKLADWSTAGQGEIHLIGVRRREFGGKFDDIFVLLIKGLVFKFQGSTDPGAVSASMRQVGAPYLTHGQHDYHFGWHKRREIALRPKGVGVLCVRDGADRVYNDADEARGLEPPNGTINIHWAGVGLGRPVNSWSEGCQVITGALYINPMNQLVRCDSFTAINNGDLEANPRKTRGAFTVMADLILALSGDLGDTDVVYTLLLEDDLALAPELDRAMADARRRVMEVVA